MAYSVVCISATDGAGAEEIGSLVANRLGFRLVGEQVVMRAAEAAGVEPHVVAGVEQRERLVARLLKELPAAGGGYALMAAMPPLEAAGRGDDDLRDLIRRTIEEVADQGDAVILAHAASLALNGKPQALRVFITASPETRATRLAEAHACDAKEARKLVSRGDAERADYRKRFYGAPSEGPSDYDLILNTDRLTAERAAELIARAAAA
jgi:cytidylate kinase